MKVEFVTCFGPGGWAKYAKKMVGSAQEHWALSADLKFSIYHHDCTWEGGDKNSPFHAVHDLAEMPEWKLFKKRWGHMDGGGRWEYDVNKFGNKVFAIWDAAKRSEADFLVWLDADTITKGAFTAEDVNQLIDSPDPDFYGLFREETFIESSVMAFNLNDSKLGGPLLTAVAQCFLAGQFQAYREWHDGFIYDAMVQHFIVNHGLLTANWSQGVKGRGSDAFNVSPWGKHMEHFKGNKKEDVEALIKAELKKHYALERLVFTQEADGVKLKELFKKSLTLDVDGFVLLGLQADAARLDEILAAIPDGVYNKYSMGLPGNRRVGLVMKPHLPPPGAKQGEGAEVRINAKDCVSVEETTKNIDFNRSVATKWLDAYAVHSEECIIASAGPSLESEMEKLKKLAAGGRKVICVKHSLPTLLKNGVVPWGCVVLDPRNIDEKSTHGIVRRDLFAEVPKETKFFLAAINNPSSTQCLLDKGADIWHWAPYSDASKKYPWPEGTRLITGGTCAALRAISIMHTLGFRTCHLFGFDGNYEGLTEEDKKKRDDMNRPLYWQVTTRAQKGKREYWSTGELMAMCQDLEKIGQNKDFDMSIHMYGNGLGQTMFREAGWANRKHYADILR